VQHGAVLPADLGSPNVLPDERAKRARQASFVSLSVLSNPTPGSGWHQPAWDVTIPMGGSGRISIQVMNTDSGNGLYVDDVAAFTTYKGSTYGSYGLPATSTDIGGHVTNFEYGSPSSYSQGANLLANGGFASGTTGWTLETSGVTTDPWSIFTTDVAETLRDGDTTGYSLTGATGSTAYVHVTAASATGLAAIDQQVAATPGQTYSRPTRSPRPGPSARPWDSAMTRLAISRPAHPRHRIAPRSSKPRTPTTRRVMSRLSPTARQQTRSASPLMPWAATPARPWEVIPPARIRTSEPATRSRQLSVRRATLTARSTRSETGSRRRSAQHWDGSSRISTATLPPRSVLAPTRLSSTPSYMTHTARPSPVGRRRAAQLTCHGATKAGFSSPRVLRLLRICMTSKLGATTRLSVLSRASTQWRGRPKTR
jgi:hypothetical protein